MVLTLQDRGEKLPSSSAMCQICSVETRVLQCTQTLSVPLQDGRSLCLCTCGEMIWYKSYMSGSPEFIPNKYKSIFPLTALEHFSDLLCGYTNMCLVLLHSCCLCVLQGSLKRPGFSADSYSPGTLGVSGADYEIEEKHRKLVNFKIPCLFFTFWKSGRLSSLLEVITYSAQ